MNKVIILKINKNNEIKNNKKINKNQLFQLYWLDYGYIIEKGTYDIISRNDILVSIFVMRWTYLYYLDMVFSSGCIINIIFNTVKKTILIF